MWSCFSERAIRWHDTSLVHRQGSLAVHTVPGRTGLFTSSFICINFCWGGGRGRKFFLYLNLFKSCLSLFYFCLLILAFLCSCFFFFFSQCPEVQMPDCLSASQIIASDSILSWWHCMWDSKALHCRIPSEGSIVLKQNFISRVLF